jgi:hypothetical protein
VERSLSMYFLFKANLSVFLRVSSLEIGVLYFAFEGVYVSLLFVESFPQRLNVWTGHVPSPAVAQHLKYRRAASLQPETVHIVCTFGRV